jgi:hypothetical protein
MLLPENGSIAALWRVELRKLTNQTCCHQAFWKQMEASGRRCALGMTLLVAYADHVVVEPDERGNYERNA